MRLSLVLFAGLYVASASALAAQGEVCLSKGNTPPASTTLDDTTVFQCKTAGTVTVPQLYEKGWRVVTALPQMSMGASGMSTVWTIIIEKP